MYIKPSKIYKRKENKLVKVSQENLAGNFFARNVDYFVLLLYYDSISINNQKMKGEQNGREILGC